MRTTYYQKLELREHGLTYREIADRLGISYQSVSQSLSKYNGTHFRVVKPSRCIFKGLREWMNQNKITTAEMCRILGLLPVTNSIGRVRRNMNGTVDFRKSDIDKVLNASNMTYEQAFGEVDGP